MKRLFHLMIAALAAAVLFSGCQKYDDTEIRQELKELGDRVTALETWCRSSQEAIDNVAKLKEAVEGMKSVKSVDAFDEDGATGYVITFTYGQSIKLYNGKDGNDGDTFFGKVEIGTECVIFTLADGSSFTVRRVKPATIGFDSYETKAIVRGDTLWTVMNPSFTKANFAAFTAELMTEDGTATAIATKSATTDASWKIEAVEPEFKEDGSLARPAGIVVAKAPQTGGKGVLRVAVIDNEGGEESSSLVIDVAPNYLSFEAVEAGATVSMEMVGEHEAPSLEFSTNLKDWTTFDFSNPQTITLENVGDKVYWKNTGKADKFSKNNDNYVHFILGEKKIAAQGNIMSLIDSSCESLTIPCDGCFISLFRNASSLEKGPELPADALAPLCYLSMFLNCSSLKDVPDLLSNELADSCYLQMFTNCTSLEKAPALPAKELAKSCYMRMFYGCTSLESAPELPATTLSTACYYGMFTNCISLKEAPTIPAAEFPDYCCYCMFDSCSSLTEAPDLLATKMGYASCFSMFFECNSLTKAPALPAKQLEEYCYQQMFCGCSSLKTAPALPATELSTSCYSFMFVNCLSLEEAPELPATTLAEYCYHGMFGGCSALRVAPELPATELAENCYLAMFEVCSSLKQAPKLPATELAPYCYTYMFLYCESLQTASDLPATELVDYCYAAMFAGCTSLEKAPELPAEHLVLACYESLFEECEKIDHVKVGFTEWGDGYMTRWWLDGTATEGSFEGPENLEAKYGSNYIPEGWYFNGKAPAAATKSFAAPATNSVRSSLCKPLASKTPGLQKRIIEPKMIML